MRGPILPLLLASFLAAGGVLWPQTGSLTATERKRIEDRLPEARGILLAGLEAKDPAVKAAAARLLRYAPSPEAWRALKALCGDFVSQPASPDAAAFREAALETLYRIDPAATVDALAAAQPRCWGWLTPAEVFSAIGTEPMGRFDNLFYYNAAAGGDTAFEALLLADRFRATKDPKYLDALAFHGYGEDADAEDMLRLYRSFRASGLPVDRIVQVMRSRGGVLEGREVRSRTFTRGELLYQAVLTRLGLGPSGLAPRAPAGDPSMEPDPAAVRRYGLPAPAADPETDPALYAFLPSVSMNLAVASLYAGKPRPQDPEVFRRTLEAFPPAEQAYYADVVARSPASPERAACLAFLAGRPDPALRLPAAAGWLAADGPGTPADPLPLLEAERDVSVRASLLELIGRRGADRSVLRLLDFLGPAAEPLLRVTAAGALFAAQGGIR